MKHDAIVTRVVEEAPRVSTIFFTVDDGLFSFTAGQYISVYFDQTGNKSGKTYSLSSIPGDPEFSITVKNIGEFSGLLCALKPGDHFVVSSAFGFFNNHDDLPIVAIAAGVGISPIWSIIRSDLEAQSSRPITLYETAPHENELIFRGSIDSLFAAHSNACAHYFVTRETSKAGENRRFSVASDVAGEALRTARFYICGAEEFVRAMWRQLMEAGVDAPRIVTETFFENS